MAIISLREFLSTKPTSTSQRPQQTVSGVKLQGSSPNLQGGNSTLQGGDYGNAAVRLQPTIAGRGFNTSKPVQIVSLKEFLRNTIQPSSQSKDKDIELKPRSPFSKPGSIEIKPAPAPSPPRPTVTKLTPERRKELELAASGADRKNETGFLRTAGRFFEELPGVGATTAKNIAQSTARNIGSVGVTLAGGKDKGFTPPDKLSRAIFGNEEVKPLQARFKENTEAQTKHIFKGPWGDEVAKVVGPLSVLGSIASDIYTGGGKNKVITEIAKSDDAGKILKNLLNLGVKQEKAQILSKQLVKVTDPKRVATILDNFIPKAKAVNRFKQEAGAFPKALGQGETYKKTAQEAVGFNKQALIKNPEAGFAKVPETMQPAKYNFPKDPLEAPVKTNIRVDKFAVTPEARTNLARIIEENKGFAAQRRGPQSFADTQKLADQLIPKTRLKKGTALNAEELQSLGDTVAGLQTKIDDFSKEIAKGNNTDNLLLSLAQAKEEMAFALASYSGATAEAGRSLSILRNLRKAGISKDIKLIQDALKLSGGRETAETIAKRLVDLGDDNLAKMKFLRDISKVKTTDKVYEVWLNSILSNPLTHAVNTTSNTLNALLRVPTRFIQAGFSKKVYTKEVPHQIVGAIEGLQDGVRRGLFVLKNGLTPSQASKLDIQHLPAIKGKLGGAVRLPTKFLSAADEFFKAIVGTSEMRSLAYRQARNEGLKGQSALKRMHEIIENPSKELYEAVDSAKLKATFQEPLGRAGTAIMEARGKVPGLKYIIPFIKTPTNIAKEAARLSPLGFANVARKALKKESVSEDAAKATIGSLIAIPVVLASLRGDITGAAPTNVNERDAFYRSGKQPYAIKVGDKWVSYRRLEPIATVIGMTADLTSVSNDEGIFNAAKQITTVMGRNLNDKTFLSGISNFLDALTDEEKRSTLFERTAEGLIPFSGARRFATQLTDKTIRKPEGFIETVKANVPGLSQQVPPRLDVFGQEPTRSLSQRISPVGVTQEKQDIVESELKRLKINLGFPSKSIAGQDLTRDEYDRYVETAGKTLKDVLEQLMNGSEWQTLNDRQKEQIIERAETKVREKVKNTFFSTKVQASKIKSRLLERGLTSQQADELTAKIVADLESKR